MQILKSLHHPFARSTEIIAIVSESVAENANVSTLRRSQEFELFYDILWRILKLDLFLHPYKVQFTQQLKRADRSHRRRYVEFALEQQTADGNISNKIFFSDETHFTFHMPTECLGF